MALKQLVLGPEYPQQCALGTPDPQRSVVVRLYGLGAPRDVTHNHLMACGAPFTIGIGVEDELVPQVKESKALVLKFHERDESERLLGELGLQLSSVLPVGGQQLCLFESRACRNYCLSRPRLWTRYLQYAYRRWRSPNSDVAIPEREVHSMIVFYFCPRPVVLATAGDPTVSNIFPLNLIGQMGRDHVCFALNKSRPVTALVKRSGRIALSSTPVEQSSLAFQLAKNHRKDWVDWGQLPFQSVTSPTLGLPVPSFALRVRELEVNSAQEVGSHTLFVARVISDERWSDGLQFSMVHGIYHAWRMRKAREESAGVARPIGAARPNAVPKS
jgi:flavin reductase (DIM6/NTAB) family NADH-FMN oxidoreductase RutF